MIAFVIVIVILALLLEKFLIGKDLDLVDAAHSPDARVVEPDEVVRIRVTLKNKSRRLIPFLRVSETFDPPILLQGEGGTVKPDVHGAQTVSFSTWLRPGQTVHFGIPVSVPRRGRYVLREFKLTGGDFLGLQETAKTCGRFHELVVAPRQLHIDRLDNMFGGFMGEMSVNRFILEDPVLTLGYREYTGREPMKMISWTQSAKGAGLMVKKYDYTLEPTVSVLLNIETETENEELLETCFALARTVCDKLERQGVKYDFNSNSVLAGVSSDPGAGEEGLGARHYSGILEHLGRATYQPRMTMEHLLMKDAKRGTAAGRILITPGDRPEPARAMARLREAAGGNLLVLRATEVAP